MTFRLKMSLKSSFLNVPINFLGLESENESCSVVLTLCDPMDCSLPGSSVNGILQARIPEWIAMAPLGDLPNPGTEPASHVSCIGRHVLHHYGHLGSLNVLPSKIQIYTKI